MDQKLRYLNVNMRLSGKVAFISFNQLLLSVSGKWTEVKGSWRFISDVQSDSIIHQIHHSSAERRRLSFSCRLNLFEVSLSKALNCQLHKGSKSNTCPLKGGERVKTGEFTCGVWSHREGVSRMLKHLETPLRALETRNKPSNLFVYADNVHSLVCLADNSSYRNAVCWTDGAPVSSRTLDPNQNASCLINFFSGATFSHNANLSGCCLMCSRHGVRTNTFLSCRCSPSGFTVTASPAIRSTSKLWREPTIIQPESWTTVNKHKHTQKH